MRVKKAAPKVLKTVNATVRKANQGIRAKKNYIKKGLTSSVIGAEEAEDGQQEQNGRAPARRRNTHPVFQKRGKGRESIQERYWKQQEMQAMEHQALVRQGILPAQPSGRMGNAQAGRNRPGGAQAGISGQNGNLSGQDGSTKSGAGSLNGTGARCIPGGNQARSIPGQRWNGGAAGTGRVAGTAAKGGTTAGTAASGGGSAAGSALAKAGSAATGAAAKGGSMAAGGAAGAATGGTAIAVMAAASAAKKAKERIQEALESSIHAKKEQARQKEQQEGKKAPGTMAGGAVFALVGFPVIFFILIIAVFFSLFLSVSSITPPASDRIVEVARQEAADWEENIGGRKYKDWYGMDADWCAMFVSWCAEECGYIKSGIMPKTASVASMRSWYQQKGQYHSKASGYEPKAGDVVIFGNGRSHTGLVVAYDADTRTVSTVEGNTGASDTTPYHKGSRVKEKKYPYTYPSIEGYGTPEYPEGTVEIPAPCGTEYSYMGWQTITSPSSKQYRLRQEAGMNFDADGFGKIGERYVVACTTTFGQVGDYVDWELDNGIIIKTVIGDIKNQNDPGCNQWGHKNGLCVLEFVVDKTSWYGSGRYPTDFHAEWEGRTVSATRTGNYWN